MRINCCDHCIGRLNKTGPGRSSSTTLSRPWANFLHQTFIAGFVKYLSPYVSQTEWHLRDVLYRHRNNAVACGMLSAATLSHLMFINDVTVTSSLYNLQLVLRIKFPYKMCISEFSHFEINRVTPFCNFFMERPSHTGITTADNVACISWLLTSW